MSRSDDLFDELTSERVRALEAQLGYQFKNRALLLQALTHRSFTHEHPAHPPHNERLEFLGDAILQLVMTRELLEQLPHEKEGTLSKLRASLVTAPRLATVAERLSLGELLFLGRSLGEEARTFPNLLADAVEALLGAMYLEAGDEGVRVVVRRLFAQALAQAKASPAALYGDHKTMLQELCIKEFKEWPKYEDVESEGPPHDRVYRCAVSICGQRMAVGEGRTKKKAEQNAAGEAMEILRQGQLNVQESR